MIGARIGRQQMWACLGGQERLNEIRRDRQAIIDKIGM
jgi:hypothetical protein